MTGTEESTLVLGVPKITVKVCFSLKRLLIVTFNIKIIRIQSSKCSHPIFLASKFLSNTYALTNLTPITTTPSGPYLSFNRIQLRSHYLALL